MVSLFLSHSSQDRDLVDGIRQRLRTEGFEAVFLSYDPDQGIPAGRRWEPELYSALQRSDAVLFVGTESSVNSRWCFAELALARSTGKAVFPLRISQGVSHPLVDDVQWADVAAQGEGGYARLWAAMRDRGFASADSFDWDPRRPPYPGLAAYGPEDAAVFFGRSDIVNGLLGKMSATLRPPGHPFVAVVGPSGCGKSSLIRAGLVPRLLRLKPDWVVVDPFTPGSSPVSALARSLSVAMSGSAGQRAAITKRLREEPSDFPELVKDLVTSRPGQAGSVLLVIDQAEQLLTREESGGLAAAEVREFVNILRQSPERDPAVWIVCTLRSEFLGTVARDPDLVMLVRDPVVVGPLERAGLPEVIEGPAQRAGVRFDPGLVQRMVDDTRGGDALPLLGYALQQLYQKRRPDGLITSGAYAALGGVEGALRQRADEVLEALQARGYGDAVIPALLRLVAIDERDEPLGRAAAISAFSAAQRQVVEAFVDARLLISGGDADSAVVQVAHETLFRAWPPIREAITASRDALRIQTELERLARDWESADRRDSYLLRGDRLQQAEAWLARHAAGAAAGLTEFLECSRARDAAALRRESELVASRVLIKLDEDPERGILLTLAAIEEYAPTPGAIRALDAAVRASRIRARLKGHDASVNSVAYSPDGSQLLTSSDDGTARTWGTGRRNEILVLRGHSARVRCAEYSPDGTRILTASDDHTISVWDAVTGEMVFSVKEGDRVYWATWSSDGELIANMTGLTGYLTLRDARNGALLAASGMQPTGASLDENTNDRVSVAFSPDRTQLVTGGGYFGSAGLWRITEPGDLSRTGRFGNRDGNLVHSVVYSPDGTRVLAGSADGTARVYEVADGTRTLSIQSGAGAVNSVRYSADGTLMLTAGFDKASVWEAADGAEVFSLPGHRSAVLSAVFSPDQKEIATGSRDGDIRLWAAEAKDGMLAVRHADRLSSGCFSPDASRILTAAGKTANVFSASDGSLILSIAGHHDKITWAAFSPDGSMIVTCSYDYTARAWDSADGREILYLSVHDSPVQHAAFSADGSRIITCSGGKGIGGYILGGAAVWDAKTGGRLYQIRADEDECVNSARFSPDDTRIVAALSRPEVRIWDVASRQEIQSLTGHTEETYYAEFSPDGSRVVSASADGTARVWDACDGNELVVLRGHSGSLISAAFSPDGTRIVTASADEMAIVWDASAGRPLSELCHGARLSGAAFSPDGSRILTTGVDGVARIWSNYRPDELIALAKTRVFRALTDAERDEYGLPGAVTQHA
jgi:WD40 repeat protein